MQVNKKIIIWIMIFTIIAVVPSPFMWTIANAEETLEIEDGVYDVQLQYSPAEIESEDLFRKDAILAALKGSYKLLIPLKNVEKMTVLNVTQVNEIVPFQLNQTEKLVQLELHDLQQPIIIDGTVVLPLEEEPVHFSSKINIDTSTLQLKEETVPPVEEQPEPTPPPIEEEKPKELSLHYILLADGEDEPSIMNTYVDPVAKIIQKDSKYFAQMTILKSSWVTGFTVEQRGVQVEPETISLNGNVRIIQFEVADFTKKLRMWVKVDIPELLYHHQYYVQLQFDEKQVAELFGNGEVPEDTESEDKENKPIVGPSTSVITKPAITQPTALDKKPALFSPLPTVPTTQIALEEQLAFDRALDAELEKVEEKPAPDETQKKKEEVAAPSAIDQQLAQLDKIKIALLAIICLLSGVLLVRRLKNAKKETTEE
ncbi:MAG: NEAT domain-containing protein [Lysinibacillus sp.]